jgi:sulfur-oxidizing protein SoxX
VTKASARAARRASGAWQVVRSVAALPIVLGGLSPAMAHGADGPAVSPAAVAAWPTVDDGLPRPLAGPGDARRGREIALGREASCTLCHRLPAVSASEPAPPGGDIGPALAGVGARLGAAQFRLRLVDSTRINPESVMPAYYRVDGLVRVSAALAGKPVLDAGQVEDVVAWLQSLK